MGRTWLLAALLGFAGPSLGCTVRAAGNVVVDSPPPRPRYRQSVAQQPGLVWVRGRWLYRSGRWEWRRGRWIKARAGFRYLPGSWVQRRGRYHWVEGRWQRSSTSDRRRGYRRR
ncbi:MAG: YXWGXW repeat-containing protein [Deltaproteobacteria bacterium]|nr:YXWGXW repeat-containing protein [Deltaproteobacteria bacterium]